MEIATPMAATKRSLPPPPVIVLARVFPVPVKSPTPVKVKFSTLLIAANENELSVVSAADV
ncbi:MAG: hypothetical protein WCF80_08630 [Pseudolabrys sp.]